MALLGCGIACVMARSFAFIYSRNQPSLGLVGIVITHPSFYELAVDDAEVSIDLEANKLQVKGREFGFDFSEMEKKLFDLGGITQAFHKYERTCSRRCASRIARGCSIARWKNDNSARTQEVELGMVSGPNGVRTQGVGVVGYPKNTLEISDLSLPGLIDQNLVPRLISVREAKLSSIIETWVS